MTEVAAAEALILKAMPSFGSEPQALTACVGRVLGEDVFAERDQPPFDRVTMDGIAIAHRDWAQGTRAFEVAGTQAAGAPALELARPGHCIEVMTGAMLPVGADAIVPVERVQRRGNVAAVTADTVAAHQFIHARGGDRRTGSLLLGAGSRIGAPEMAVLASAGRDTFQVSVRPRVAVISTGDELVDAGEPIQPYQIRSSNDRALEASLTAHNLALVTRARLKDDAATLTESIARLHEQFDLMILSGGVSMGRFDFVPSVLQRLGAEVIFHRIKQKPGRPMWFGMSAQGKPIFALPGNPVSTLVCATRYILPALRAASGLAPAPIERVTLAAPVEPSRELTYFLPVNVAWSADGVAIAEPRPTNTSGDFVTLAGTDGFVELAAAKASYGAGFVARLFRW
jgi:molybdopterin molybdotransferase